MIYEYPNKPYWIIPIPQEQILKEPCKVLYYHSQQNNLKSYQRIIRYLLGTLNQVNTIGECYYVEHHEQYYLVIPTQKEISYFSIPINVEGKKKNVTIYLKHEI